MLKNEWRHEGFVVSDLGGVPLFAFGHGLSYTEFKYSHLRLSSDTLAAAGQITVIVEVENIGSRAGDEVAQLYVHPLKSRVKQPAKALRGFQRLHEPPWSAEGASALRSR